MTLGPTVELSVGLSLLVKYDLCLPRRGFEHPTFHMRGERSNRLRHRNSLLVPGSGKKMKSRQCIISISLLSPNEKRRDPSFESFLMNSFLPKDTLRQVSLK